MAFIIVLWPSLLLFVFTIIHYSLAQLQVPFKSVLLCYYFFSFCDSSSNKMSECGESQMVYIANGNAAQFSEVNQNEENVLLNEDSYVKSDCRWLLIITL